MCWFACCSLSHYWIGESHLVCDVVPDFSEVYVIILSAHFSTSMVRMSRVYQTVLFSDGVALTLEDIIFGFSFFTCVLSVLKADNHFVYHCTFFWLWRIVLQGETFFPLLEALVERRRMGEVFRCQNAHQVSRCLQCKDIFYQCLCFCSPTWHFRFLRFTSSTVLYRLLNRSSTWRVKSGGGSE